LRNEDDEEEPEAISSGPTMTEAERRFERIRKQRLAERVAKQARLSHKDRVDAFNRDLESRTEHFEMKRVGGGG
jgi:protein FAM32A